MCTSSQVGDHWLWKKTQGAPRGLVSSGRFLTCIILSNMWARGRKEMSTSSCLGKITFCRWRAWETERKETLTGRQQESHKTTKRKMAPEEQKGKDCQEEGSSGRSEALSHSVNEARLAGGVKSTEMYTEGDGEVSPWQKAHHIHTAHAGIRGSPWQRTPFLFIAFYQEMLRPWFALATACRPAGSWCKPGGTWCKSAGSWCKPTGPFWKSAGLYRCTIFPHRTEIYSVTRVRTIDLVFSLG